MMSQGHGVVETIKDRAWTNLVFYSFKLEGDNEWYSIGTTSPTFSEGQTITFQWEIDKKGYRAAKPRTIQVSAASGNPATVASSPSPTSTAGGGTKQSKDGYWEAKDVHQKTVVEPRISYAASRHDAVALVSAAIAADAIGFGTTARGKRLGQLIQYVEQVTDEFFLSSMRADAHLKELLEEAAEKERAIEVSEEVRAEDIPF